MDNMKKCNYVISAVSAVLGISIMFMSKQLSIDFTKYGPGAGFWPFILGLLLALIGVLLIITTIVNKKKLEAIPVVLNETGNKKVYIMMGIITVFCVFLSILGFYISILLFLPVNMLLMGIKNKKKIVLSTLIIIVSVYVVFELVLKTTLPKPFFLE
jgi:hypothetical protein